MTTFIHSPQRLWLDLAVASILLSLLGFGSVYIYHLNNDAREEQLDSAQAMRGQQISTDQGCIACHTMDGSKGVGPSWKDMWGRTETLENGSTITVDADYFRHSIKEPNAQVVQGYPNVMLRYFLEDDQVDDLMAFVKSISKNNDETPDK